MPEQYYRLISKYALILATFLAIEYAYSNYLVDKLIDIDENPTLKPISSIGLKILLNLLMALIINADINRLKIKTQYVTIVTLISKPIGVVAFLLYVVFDKDKLENQKNRD